MLDFTINYLWVFVLSVLAIGFGALWYSPIMFGKFFMKLSGMDSWPPEKKDEVKKKEKIRYVLGFMGALVMFAALDAFLTSIQAASLLQGAIAGMAISIGFIGVTTLNHVLWGGSSLKLWLLNLAYYIAVFIVAGSVLAVV